MRVPEARLQSNEDDRAASGRRSASSRARSLPARLVRAAGEELCGLDVRLLIARLLLLPLPQFVGGRVRAAVLRLAGLSIGRGTLMATTPEITGGKDLRRHLKIGRNCWINSGCVLEVHAAVTIEDGAGLGQQSMVLTQAHEMGGVARRYADLRAQPVHIGRGAWVGARAVILPGVTIGEGAVVAAGAVVTRDVAPNTMVGGVPARVLRDDVDRPPARERPV